MAIRIEQNIFKTIVQMSREMDRAEQMNQAKTRLLNQVQQAFKDAKALTYDEDEECELQHVDLREPEHPYIESIIIVIRHWVAEQRLEVGTLTTTQYDEEFCEEMDYHYVGSLGEGMTQVESAVVENLTTIVEKKERYVIALAKFSQRMGDRKKGAFPVLKN
jgi:K+-sensing histidine kinase KdpD